MPRTASAATARTNITLRILLSGLHLRSHQTDFIDPGAVSGVDRLGYPLEVYGRVALDEDHAIDPGAVSGVDRLGYPLEVYGRVALDEDHALGARLKDLLETAAQMGVIGSLAVDGQVVRGINRDDHGTLVRLVRLLVWRRRLGHESLKSLRRKRRDHHENDNQHQQHVDHGRHVDVRLDTLCPANGH